MQRLECPIGDCTAVIEAETTEEVMDQASDHAAEKHPEMEMDPETTQTIRDDIRTV